jgi:hypothetical protein
MPRPPSRRAAARPVRSHAGRGRGHTAGPGLTIRPGPARLGPQAPSLRLLVRLLLVRLLLVRVLLVRVLLVRVLLVRVLLVRVLLIRVLLIPELLVPGRLLPRQAAGCTSRRRANLSSRGRR